MNDSWMDSAYLGYYGVERLRQSPKVRLVWTGLNHHFSLGY